ncbi:MAG: ribonuclease P protein component [Anaerolineales bacterium]|nr:ribonuclease P protein component [Anaerolineales bacterium]
MKRKFRLTRDSDFKRVRRSGKSYAHPLLVLVVLPEKIEKTIFGISASRSVGIATRRNRAKRLLREALRPLLPDIRPGWKVILIARQPLLDASFLQIQAALEQLLRKADLLQRSDGN